MVLARPLPFALVALVLWAPSGCGTVDLGPTPADVNACRPNQEFFYDQVWPNFLAKDYGGKHCNDTRCHDSSSGLALNLTAPTSQWTDRTMPMPTDWFAVYKSASEQVLCTSVASSPLLIQPTSTSHKGGKLFEPGGPEQALVEAWVAKK